MKKRLLSGLLIVVLLLTMLPVSVLAEEIVENEPLTEVIPEEIPEETPEHLDAYLESNLFDIYESFVDDVEQTFYVKVHAQDDAGKQTAWKFGFWNGEGEIDFTNITKAEYQIGDGERVAFSEEVTTEPAALADGQVTFYVTFADPGNYVFSATLVNKEAEEDADIATDVTMFEVGCNAHADDGAGFCSVCGDCIHEMDGETGYCKDKECTHGEDCWKCGGKDTTKPGGTEEPAADAPAAPDFETLQELGLKVAVDCDNVDHDEPIVYDLVEGTGTAYVYDLDGVWYCSVMVEPDFYILMYNSEVRGEHEYAARNVPSFTLQYVEEAWTAVEDTITLHVDCVPEEPAEYFVITAESSYGGRIDPEGYVYVDEGADQTIWFYPARGYEVAAVYVDGYLVNYYGLCYDHHWSCMGCHECAGIDWSKWYTCGHTWCGDKYCDHYYAPCTWNNWQKGITFYDVDADHTLYVEFAPIPKDCPSEDYWDLDTKAWYHSATDYVIAHDLMKGVGGRTFDPYGATTRAQLVTMLYRLAGEPVVGGSSAFADVPAGAWYTSAIIWAANKGIVEGYGDGTFGINDVVTREQMVTILYRYARYMGCNVKDLASLSRFLDEAEVSDFAVKPFGWAVAEDIVEGKPAAYGQVKLEPQGTTARVEMAAVLMRYAEYVG